jgi:hypothetical protein
LNWSIGVGKAAFVLQLFLAAEYPAAQGIDDGLHGRRKIHIHRRALVLRRAATDLSAWVIVAIEAAPVLNLCQERRNGVLESKSLGKSEDLPRL